MELFEHIRRDRREEHVSIRGLARRHHVHRRTVRQALLAALLPPRQRAPRVAPQLGPHRATIRAWLVADLSAPRKQRHTARRIWQRLVDERGASVAESTVRAYVDRLRPRARVRQRRGDDPPTASPGQGGGGRLREGEHLPGRGADRGVNVAGGILPNQLYRRPLLRCPSRLGAWVYPGRLSLGGASFEIRERAILAAAPRVVERMAGILSERAGALRKLRPYGAKLGREIAIPHEFMHPLPR